MIQKSKLLRVAALLAGCSALLISTGCTSVTKSGQTTSIAIESAQPVIETDVRIDYANPVTAQVVQTRVLIFTVESPDTYAEGGVPSSSFAGGFKALVVQKLKSAALASALASAKCDRLVDPQYSVTETGFLGLYKRYEVTVKGYPATITGIRQVKK